MKISYNSRAKRILFKRDSQTGQGIIVLPKRHKKFFIVSQLIPIFQKWFKTLPPFSKKEVSFEKHILYQGDLYQISRHIDQEVIFDSTHKICYVFEQSQDISLVIKTHLQKSAYTLFNTKSHEYAKQLGVSLGRIRIKETKRQWGSCSIKNDLSYSWRLIMAPSFVLDYICAHEVAHCSHRNHGPDFWNTVQRLHPSFKEARSWLRKNGRLLFQYMFS